MYFIGMSENRLPWKRASDGFIAFPDGEGLRERVATLSPSAVRPASSRWAWMVRYDGASSSGLDATSQQAADAATRAWPGLKAQALRLGRKNAVETDLAEMLEAIDMEKPVDPRAFNLELASEARLKKLMDWCRPHIVNAGMRGNPPLAVATMAAALSAEFYRRRSR